MTVSKLNPYINVIDKAREALEFYKGVFGGNLTMTTFKEGMGSTDPSEDNNIMHGQLDADNGITLMVSDKPKAMENAGTVGAGNISISLSGDNEAELRGYWDKLSEGANITMPINKAPWGDTFGMLTDKYGTDWMVNIAGSKPAA